MISIIIVSYNTSDLLRKCLKSIDAACRKEEMEVIVVDNDSSDDSAIMVETEYPRVKLIANEDNKGFAAANNQAFAVASGDYLVLINPDSVIENDALENAVGFMRENPGCGISGGLLLTEGGSPAPSARRFPNGMTKFFTISGLASLFPGRGIFSRHEFGGFDHRRPLEVDWVPGAFTVIRKEVLEETGGFDERFFLYYEETDLCLRAKARGWKVYFYPGARIRHVGGASGRKLADRKFDSKASQVTGFRMRSEWLYHRKNGGIPAVLASAGVEFLWNLLRLGAGLVPGRRGGDERRRTALGVLKGVAVSLFETRMGRVSPPAPWR